MWSWRLDPAPSEPAGGTGPVEGPVEASEGSEGPVEGPPGFEARADAETWIGEHWRSLSAVGVRRAQLLDDGTPVGEPLPLPEVADEGSD
jgi:hypothetical protein